MSRCKGKKRGKENADVLEPEKCPLPREVGPFFPLLTGGENIYKTNRAHITSESSKTHLSTNITQLHAKSIIPKRQGSIWLQNLLQARWEMWFI